MLKTLPLVLFLCSLVLECRNMNNISLSVPERIEWEGGISISSKIWEFGHVNDMVAGIFSFLLSQEFSAWTRAEKNAFKLRKFTSGTIKATNGRTRRLAKIGM